MIREMARRRNSTRALGEIGCPTWNRTKIYGFRDRRATVALQGKKVVLPAGIAPATVWFEASRADLLRYGSISCAGN